MAEPLKGSRALRQQSLKHPVQGLKSQAQKPLAPGNLQHGSEEWERKSCEKMRHFLKRL